MGRARRRGIAGRAAPLGSPAMSVTVVGSIAFDAVKTPFGERERMLGGSAVHFSLAASFFDDVHVVGPMLNDAELRQLTREPNLIRAAKQVRTWGPSVTVAKRGEYGAAMITDEGFFGLPAFPLETVVDPTGAGDSFAGGFVGYVAAHAGEGIDHTLLARAMAYGTALASFNVEEFGVERVARLTGEELAERVSELQRVTQFDGRPIALRH